MKTGTVKRLVRDRGFGFIRTDTHEEFFFHRSAVLDGSFEDLTEGQAVSFESVDTGKGPRAADVRVLSTDPRRV